MEGDWGREGVGVLSPSAAESFEALFCRECREGALDLFGEVICALSAMIANMSSVVGACR